MKGDRKVIQLLNGQLAVLAALSAPLPAWAYGDCSPQAGVAKARCERHGQMYKQCGALKGDAHHACDREFLLANPLKCDALAGPEAARCTREVAAFKDCASEMGREFSRCVSKATGESPMGH